MITILKKSMFSFLEIDEECKGNFKEVAWHDLSDFQNAALRWVGDAIRGNKSQEFWCNGCYCWYTDEKQSVEECVWITNNNILMYEKISEGKLYRITFNND